MDDKFVITIGRQFGSGGMDVGRKLAKYFDISFFDKELLKIASKESGFGSEFFEKADEKKGYNIFGELFGLKTSPYVDDWYSNSFLSNETLFKIQSDIIKELSNKQSCVFVGRCADYILRDNIRCINIFLTREINERIELISKQEHITKEKAKELIEKTEKKRASYYNFFSNKIWGMASSYDLCLNTSVLGIDESVNYIINFVEKKLS